MEAKAECEFLQSRIEDIHRTIYQDPNSEKYLREDLEYLEDELEALQQSRSLRTAQRKIKKYLKLPTTPKNNNQL